MKNKKGLSIKSSPVTSVHVSVLHDCYQVGSMSHWFLSILKQGKYLFKRDWLTTLVLCTFAGAKILSIRDYVTLSFSFSKDQNIILKKKNNKDSLQDKNNSH